MAPVRPAGARELDRLVALWSALVEHHRSLDPHWRTSPGADDEYRALLERLLGDPDALVLVFDRGDGHLCGFCTAQLGLAPPFLSERARCEITDLFVRESERRRGVGLALLRGALDWCRARGVQRIAVRVAADNVEGQAFWRAAGFGDFVDVLQLRL